jgi:hypothetical protein
MTTGKELQAEERMRVKFVAAIAEYGIVVIKEAVYPDFLKIVASTRMKKRFGFDTVIATGFSHFDPDSFTMGIKCIIEAMPDGDEKVEVQETYDYWIANIDEIMADHHVTRD